MSGFADATGRYLPLVCTLNASKIISVTEELLGVGHDEFAQLAMAGADRRERAHDAAVPRR